MQLVGGLHQAVAMLRRWVQWPVWVLDTVVECWDDEVSLPSPAPSQGALQVVVVHWRVVIGPLCLTVHDQRVWLGGMVEHKGVAWAWVQGPPLIRYGVRRPVLYTPAPHRV